MAKLSNCTIDRDDYRVCNNCKAIYPKRYNQCPKCQRMLEQVLLPDGSGKYDDYEIEH